MGIFPNGPIWCYGWTDLMVCCCQGGESHSLHFPSCYLFVIWLPVLALVFIWLHKEPIHFTHLSELYLVWLWVLLSYWSELIWAGQMVARGNTRKRCASFSWKWGWGNADWGKDDQEGKERVRGTILVLVGQWEGEVVWSHNSHPSRIKNK